MVSYPAVTPSKGEASGDNAFLESACWEKLKPNQIAVSSLVTWLYRHLHIMPCHVTKKWVVLRLKKSDSRKALFVKNILFVAGHKTTSLNAYISSFSRCSHRPKVSFLTPRVLTNWEYCWSTSVCWPGGWMASSCHRYSWQNSNTSGCAKNKS